MDVEGNEAPSGDEPNHVLENGDSSCEDVEMAECFFPNCSERVPKTQVIQPVVYETMFFSQKKSVIGDFPKYEDKPICKRCERECRKEWAKFNAVSFGRLQELCPAALEATLPSVTCYNKAYQIVGHKRNSSSSSLSLFRKMVEMSFEVVLQQNKDIANLSAKLWREMKKTAETAFKRSSDRNVICLSSGDESDDEILPIMRDDRQDPMNPKRNEVKVGTSVFFVDGNLRNPWRRGLCVKVVVQLNQNIYVVKDNDTSKLRNLSLNQLAYITPPEEPAIKHANRVIVKTSDKTFISGMIMFVEKNMGKEQIYQIHLDNGETNNFPHSSIRVICAQSNQEVWRDVAKTEQAYVKHCLSIYPDRLMIKPKEWESVSVHNGKEYMVAKVVKIESNMVHLKYASGKQEFIHVGSPRFKGVRNAISTETDIGYSIDKHGRMINADMSGRAKELNFVPHNCSPSCYILEYGPDRHRFEYTFEKCKKCPIYAIPIFLGWRRQILNTRTTKKVSYRAPCGRRLSSITAVHKYLCITKSHLEISFFTFDPNVRALVMFEALNVKWKCDDYSQGKEMIPISCVNSVNTDMVDMIEYCTARKIHRGAHLEKDEGFLLCCDCTDNCQDKNKCQCHQLTLSEEQHLKKSKEVKYHTGYNFRVLTGNVTSGIYECNSKCSCRPQLCHNRVVQFPLRSHLQVFKTVDYGWGLRTLIDLPQGVFVCIYVGNLFVHGEAMIIGSETWGKYLADLDLIEVAENTKEGYEEDAPELSEDSDMDNSSDEVETPEFIELSASSTEEEAKDEESDRRSGNQKSRKRKLQEVGDSGSYGNRNRKANRSRNGDADGDEGDKDEPPNTSRRYFGPNEYPLIMDAMDQGNLGRFLNHACVPNLDVQNCFVDSHDIRYPWVTFFTSKYVSAGTELRWDYGYDENADPDNLNASAARCKCGTVGCRKRIIFAH